MSKNFGEYESKAPLARRPNGEPYALVPIESETVMAQPIFFYKLVDDGSLHQLVIDGQGIVTEQMANARSRRTRSFVEIKGEVEIVTIDARAIKLSPPTVTRAIGEQQRWIEIQIGEGENSQSFTLPPDMILNGLIVGGTVTEVVGKRSQNNQIIHTLVMPGPQDPAEIRKHLGKRVQLETDLPTFVLVFNPIGTEGINWQEDSTRMLIEFENWMATLLIASLPQTHPQRTQLSRMLGEILTPQAQVGSREGFFSALREAFPPEIKTHQLRESHIQLPILQRGRRLYFGEDGGGIEVLDPETRAALENAFFSFKEAIESGFLDTKEIELFLATQAEYFPPLQEDLLESNDPNSEKMGFPISLGYHSLARGLRMLIAEYNDQVSQLVRERFYPQVLVEGMSLYRSLQGFDERIAAAEALVRETQIAHQQVNNELSGYDSRRWWSKRPDIRRKIVTRAEQAGGISNASGRGLDRLRLEREQTGQGLAGAIDQVAIFTKRLFSQADITNDGPRYQALLQERARLLEREERVAAINQQIADEKNSQFDPDIADLRRRRQQIEVVRKYLASYGRIAAGQGSEKPSSYAETPKNAELLTMSDQACQTLLVICEYMGRMREIEYRTRPRLGDPRSSLKQQFDLWPTYWLHSSFGKSHSYNNSITQESVPDTRPLGDREVSYGAGHRNLAALSDVITAWAERRSLNEGTARAVLLAEYHRRASYLGILEFSEGYERGILSQASWVREAFAQTLALCSLNLSATDAEANISRLRQSGLLLPPLGMIVESLDRREVPVVAMATRVLVDNRGFLFAGKNLNKSQNYRERNNDLAEVSRYIARILKRLMPNIDEHTLEANLTKFTSPDLPSRTPEQIYDAIRRQLPAF